MSRCFFAVVWCVSVRATSAYHDEDGASKSLTVQMHLTSGDLIRCATLVLHHPSVAAHTGLTKSLYGFCVLLIIRFYLRDGWHVRCKDTSTDNDLSRLVLSNRRLYLWIDTARPVLRLFNHTDSKLHHATLASFFTTPEQRYRPLVPNNVFEQCIPLSLTSLPFHRNTCSNYAIDVSSLNMHKRISVTANVFIDAPTFTLSKTMAAYGVEEFL